MSGGDEEGRARFSRRAAVLGLAQLACFGAVGARLYQIQVRDEGRYVPLAEDNRMTVHVVMPERGRILDRFGVVLAGNEESYRATLVPSQAGDLRQTLAVFARVVPITAAEQERIVQRARRQSRSGLLLLASDLSFEQVAALGLIAPRLPGVETERSPRRRYHRGAALGHVVGHVGAVDRLALDDTPLLRVPGVRIGKAGVELAMEEELRGVAGSRRLEVDARGAVVRKLGETPPSRGRDVVLTVDAALQERVMERLKAERRAAVVALDVTRGEVVAMASVPSFDPDEIARGAAPESWQRQLADPDKPLLSRAAGGLYPPGSTFKMVTALAALEAGVVTPRERFHCDGGFDLAGQHFRCWSRSGHGRVDLHRALKVSCDVYFYELARRVGILALARMARRLGFGEVFEGGIGPQKAGVVPDPDWKRGETGRGWLGGETVLTGIGQGFVTATPLQLATMAARLATGRRVTPTLVRGEARSREGADGGGFLPLDIDPGWLDAVRRGLHAAVNEDGGTGGNAALERGTDEMAGKTGTAQISRSSSDRPQSELPWEQRDHALFAGYAPADRPRYAVAAVVEHGGGGGAVAAPLARDVMAMLLAEDPMARPGYSVTDAGRAASGRRAVTG